jgi:hypothetical protein
MVTAVPPPTAPEDGLMLTNVGGGGGAVTVTTADPDTPVYPLCIEVAVMVAEPVPEGVNTPEEVIVPPVAVHVTPALNVPVPVTVAVQVAVCAVVIEVGEHITETDVTVGGVGGVGGVLLELLVPPPHPDNSANPKASTKVQKALCPNMSHHRGEIRPRNIKDCQCETIILQSQLAGAPLISVSQKARRFHAVPN